MSYQIKDAVVGEIDLNPAIEAQQTATRNHAIRQLKEKSYREQNRELGDVLIESQGYNADAAYSRLRLLRTVRNEWQTNLNAMDTRDIPASTIEKYETIWAAMRELEAEELALINIGV